MLTQKISERGVRNREIIRECALDDHVVLVPTFYLDSPKYRERLEEEKAAPNTSR